MCWTTGTFCQPAAGRPVRHAEPAARRDTPSPSTRVTAWRHVAAGLPVGRRFGLPEPCGTGAQGSQLATVPETFYTDPLMYQGGSDDFLGPCDAAVFASDEWGIDFESRGRSDHRPTWPWAPHADDRIGQRAPDDAGQRLEPAQSDPGRAGQGLRLCAKQAGHRLQPGGRDAGRSRRGLGRAGACTCRIESQLERPACGPVQCAAPKR